MSAAPDSAALAIRLTPGPPRPRVRIRRLAGLAFPGLVLAVFVFTGVFAPLLAPRDPKELVLVERMRPPVWQDGGSWDHPLGTDNVGRDILSRLIYGARISLLVVALTIPLSAAFGTLVGALAGWRLGAFDRMLMRVVDVQLAMPAILFALLLASVFGPSLRNVIIIIVVWTWSGYARLVRGEALSLRERDFVLAARSTGAGAGWILVRHIFPNVLNAVVILATLEVAAVILTEASLSFLGVGVGLGTPSWGTMISEGRNFLTIAWWLVGIPGIAVVLVSLSGNLAGDWLRDALDPRLRNNR
jgi:peptide/nickel transport system permease protein